MYGVRTRKKDCGQGREFIHNNDNDIGSPGTPDVAGSARTNHNTTVEWMTTGISCRALV